MSSVSYLAEEGVTSNPQEWQVHWEYGADNSSDELFLLRLLMKENNLASHFGSVMASCLTFYCQIYIQKKSVKFSSNTDH